MKLVSLDELISLNESIIVLIDLSEALAYLFPFLLAYLRKSKIAFQNRNKVILTLNKARLT